MASSPPLPMSLIAAVRAAGGSVASAGDRPAVQFLARELFAGVSDADARQRPVDDFAGAALSLWNHGRTRLPGTVVVRAFNPRSDREGWSAPHTVLQVINDDMPFLVDSVVIALKSLKVDISHLWHPTFQVRRDAGGNRLAGGLRPTGSTGGDGEWIAESVMHIEITRTTDQALLSRVEEKVRAVLDDVRLGVQDWPAICERCRTMREQMAGFSHVLPAGDIAESQAFLDWLLEEGFIFLGHRENRRNEDGSLTPVEGSGLGLLRDPARHIMEGINGFDYRLPAAQEALQKPEPLLITKANAYSQVHRNVRYDYIGMRLFDSGGRVYGESRIIGLFTHAAYARETTRIPILRRKVAEVLSRSGLSPSSHDGKALVVHLMTYPVDELFGVPADAVMDHAKSVISLTVRPRTIFFSRRDEFGRFVSATIHTPRVSYNQELHNRFTQILEQAYESEVLNYYLRMPDDNIVWLNFILPLGENSLFLPDDAGIAERLMEASLSWSDRFMTLLNERKGVEESSRLAGLYGGDTWPRNYQERFKPETALLDIPRLETAGRQGCAVNVWRPVGSRDNEGWLRLFSARATVLSDTLPIMERMGLRVLSEERFVVTPAATEPVNIHELRFTSACVLDRAVIERLEAAFLQVRENRADNDSFNRLVIDAGLDWREVVLFRTLSRYLQQTGVAFSLEYMAGTLALHPLPTRSLLELFMDLHDPRRQQQADSHRTNRLFDDKWPELLETLPSLNEDRVFNRLLNLIRAILRTNFFQADAFGDDMPRLALKLDSHAIEGLPLPRPHVEIFVHAPGVEGIHLRGGAVARGGLRWSDRNEDFRAEILGLMKAQMIKNAVITPVGAKGGFVLKRPPSGDGTDSLSDRAIRAYRVFLNGLLDLTDNYQDGRVVPPPDTVRRDGDDPYLVVAADKGTASFSDIANETAMARGFWLGDAFASGGSAGYDHKKMGITARGAYEALRRHFMDMGKNPDTDPFTIAGIGDMSGDVFGNGLLLSPQARLIAAFDHRHIMIDPEPDPVASLAERQRLFALPRSSWDDYDRAVLSPGGMVIDRNLRRAGLSPRAAARLGIDSRATPQEVIQAILRLDVDVLWNGGIGCYVRAGNETHTDCQDRANDALRINACQLRAQVVIEGGNMGLTQRGRIEYARHGGRINIDAVDNSAGVDASDHEVNIKILLNRLVQAQDLTVKQRNILLAGMTDDVAALVLENNRIQALALGIAERRASEPGPAWRFMQHLERQGRLDRAVEALPDDSTIRKRQETGRPFSRPELAVLNAYAKNMLYDEILASTLPDDPFAGQYLVGYFPGALAERFPGAIASHDLSREIISTCLSNLLVNHGGPFAVPELAGDTGLPAGTVARAMLIAISAVDGGAILDRIDGADRTAAEDRYRALALYQEALEAIAAFVPSRAPAGDTGKAVRQMKAWWRKLSGDGGGKWKKAGFPGTVCETLARLEACRHMHTATPGADAAPGADATPGA